MKTDNHIQRITEEARVAFEYLHNSSPRDWNYKKIAELINGLTDRKMDSSAARRFVVKDLQKTAVFKSDEAIKIREAALAAKEEFDKKIESSGIQVTGVFTEAAHTIDLKIPVSPDLFNCFNSSSAFQDFITKTVNNAIEFAEKGLVPKPD